MTSSFVWLLLRADNNFGDVDAEPLAIGIEVKFNVATHGVQQGRRFYKSQIPLRYLVADRSEAGC